jgi:hypothetical protein
MMAKTTGVLALLCLLFTLLWLGMLISDNATAGPLGTFEQVAEHAARPGLLFYTTYLNAGLVTLSAVAFFAAMYAYLKPTASGWLVIGLVFVPIYGALNLVVYLSQVTLIPTLLALRLDPRYTEMVDVLLRLGLQAWLASPMAFFNGFAYAVLGIPSILFGWLLWKRTGGLRWGGVLLALNGIACILGLIGYLTGNHLLSQGILMGGVLFLLALILISWGLLRRV